MKKFPLLVILLTACWSNILAQDQTYSIAVGDTVIVKPEVNRYMTGEKISSWVYTVKHTIRQVGSAFHENGVLLKGIRSWLHKDDVTPVNISNKSLDEPTTIVQSSSDPPSEPVIENPVETTKPIEEQSPVVTPQSSVQQPIRLVGQILSQDEHQIAGATLTLVNQNISTTTNQAGQFSLTYLEAGDEEVIIEAQGYISAVELVQLTDNQTLDMGTIILQPDMSREVQNEILLNLAEQDLNDDEGRTQEQASAASSSSDVFNNLTSFTWSTARYRNRGYEQLFEQNYIEGISFNSAERGQFNFSMMGGLNDASRYKETVNSMEANNFSFGGLGNATNYLMSASNYAQGWKVSAAGTNRNYKAAARASFCSGPLGNGWTFMGQLAFRFGPYTNQIAQIGEGIDYYSLGYFFSAEKKWGDRHRLSLITLGAPTQRGQSAAVTQEVYDLTNQYNPTKWGWNNYNPYWGYQDGKMRNSRIVKSYDPTIIVGYEFKIDNAQKLHFGLGYHYSMYSNSAISFYNAPDPRPDYYRNLPSFLWDGQLTERGGFITRDYNDVLLGTPDSHGNIAVQTYNGLPVGRTVDMDNYKTLTDLWTSRNSDATQINWNSLYAANYANNVIDPTGSASYMVERRHNDITEGMFSFNYSSTKYDHLKMTAGLEVKESVGIHYKTVDDLLGGNQWIDLDAFAERDIKELATNIGLSQADIAMVKQNDVNNPNRAVKEGDRFGYDYNIYMNTSKAWFQNEWRWNNLDLYYALQLTYSDMKRTSSMVNGRAKYLAMLDPSQEDIYLGENKHSFIDPAFKVGFNYKVNGRNFIKFNALAMTQAPLARDAYISPRVHDRAITSIYTHDNASSLKEYYAASQKVVAGDITYEFNYPVIRGRITGFYTRFWNGSELNGYYDDESRTFVNQAMTGINRRHCGIEAAFAVKLGTYFTLTGATSIGDYRYVGNAYSITSAENGMALASKMDENGKDVPVFEIKDSVMINGLHVSNGPQLNASLKLSFFHPKMWFADITISYFDWNWLDYAPSRRMYGLYYGVRADGTKVNGSFKQVYTDNTSFKDARMLEADGTTPVLDQYGTPRLQDPYRFMADQESLVSSNAWDRFIIDVSVGKLIYLANRQSLSINLSVSNLTNNVNLKTGGYQQSRLPRSTRQGITDSSNENSTITSNIWKFPSKYYYAWGTNFYLTLTYKF